MSQVYLYPTNYNFGLSDYPMKDTELKRQRDRALYEAYIKGLEEGRFASMRDAAEFVRQQPAPQFYISPREASLQIGRIEARISLIGLNSLSRRKIWDLYDRYVLYLRQHPDTSLTRERILEILVEEPAPQFYIGAEMARKILQQENARIRKKWQNG